MQLCTSFTGLAVRTENRSHALKNNAPQQKYRRAISTVTKASVVAEPASLDVKSVDGKSAGTAALSLRVADPETSKGLVHRYVVMVRQNMRQVCLHCVFVMVGWYRDAKPPAATLVWDSMTWHIVPVDDSIDGSYQFHIIFCTGKCQYTDQGRGQRWRCQAIQAKGNRKRSYRNKAYTSSSRRRY